MQRRREIRDALIKRVVDSQHARHDEDFAVWLKTLGLSLGKEQVEEAVRKAEATGEAAGRRLFSTRVPTEEELRRVAAEAVYTDLLDLSLDLFLDLKLGERSRGPLRDLCEAIGGLERVRLLEALKPFCQPGLAKHNQALLAKRLREAVINVVRQA